MIKKKVIEKIRIEIINLFINQYGHVSLDQILSVIDDYTSAKKRKATREMLRQKMKGEKMYKLSTVQINKIIKSKCNLQASKEAKFALAEVANNLTEEILSKAVSIARGSNKRRITEEDIILASEFYIRPIRVRKLEGTKTSEMILNALRVELFTENGELKPLAGDQTMSEYIERLESDDIRYI